MNAWIRKSSWYALTLTLAWVTSVVAAENPYRSSITHTLKLRPKAKAKGIRVRKTNKQWVDLSIHVTSPSRMSVGYSGRPKWITIRGYVRNNGGVTARRVVVKAKGPSERWAAVDDFILSIPAGGKRDFTVKVCIPGKTRRRSRIRVTADPDDVNHDSNRDDNSTSMEISIHPRTLPDLKIVSFKSKKKKSSLHLGKLKRGWAKLKYSAAVKNAGTASSGPCKLRVVAYKAENKKNAKARKVKEKMLAVPRLAAGADSGSIELCTLKVYVGEIARVYATADPDDQIEESDEDNNTAWKQVSVKVRNPLKKLFKRTKEIAAQGFDSATDYLERKGRYMFRKTVYETREAAAAAAARAMYAWVWASKKIHERNARPLSKDEKMVLSLYFPSWLVEEVRIAECGKWARPEFWADADGVTFDDVVVIRKGLGFSRRVRLLAHELVHVYQYHALGVKKFCRIYTKSWIDTGFSYYKICLEVEARGFVENVYDKHDHKMVGSYLGY